MYGIREARKRWCLLEKSELVGETTLLLGGNSMFTQLGTATCWPSALNTSGREWQACDIRRGANAHASAPVRIRVLGEVETGP